MYNPENKENIDPSKKNIPETLSPATENINTEGHTSVSSNDSADHPISAETKINIPESVHREPIQSEVLPTHSIEEPVQQTVSQENSIEESVEQTIPQTNSVQEEPIQQTVSHTDSMHEESVQSERVQQTASSHASPKKQCYEEHIKKQKRKKNGWAKLIAGCLITGIAGGSSIGVGYGAIQHYYNKDKTEVLANSTTPYIQKTSTGGNLSAVDIIKRVKPSVVSISTKIEGNKQAFGNFYIPFEGKGAGSGVIFYQDDKKIAIVTNNHVIENAKEVYITLENGTSLPAKVVGTKIDADLAVLTVSKSDMKTAGVSEVTIASFGKSSELEVGSPVIAIGNAMGMGLSATDGILSVTGLDIVSEGKTLHVMQTSAPINSGNSGGPLVNSAGEVIGINTGKYNSSMTEGMGYAIPSDTVLPIAEELLTKGSSPSPHIGIVGTSITKDDASLYKLPVGTLIMEVTEGGPADQAGIQAGDIITQFNGKSIMDMESLVKIVEKTEVGASVPVHIIRNGETPMDVTLVIGDKNK